MSNLSMKSAGKSQRPLTFQVLSAPGGERDSFGPARVKASEMEL
jgi:hypothetical protein